MLTLSIQQPWPWAIFNLDKDIENRTWKTNIKGTVLIHAGKKIDKEGYDYLSTGMKYKLPKIPGLKIGGIVGSVDIVDCVEKSDSKWFIGPYGFVLRNPKTIVFLPIRGQLGFFDTKYECYMV